MRLVGGETDPAELADELYRRLFAWETYSI
jgi:hypothetical protein